LHNSILERDRGKLESKTKTIQWEIFNCDDIVGTTAQERKPLKTRKTPGIDSLLLNFSHRLIFMPLLGLALSVLLTRPSHFYEKRHKIFFKIK
jgi:hypothetical protein